MPLLFALTMFVSATLLFLVQPMIGKMVLPLLGGTPAVWNTCMVFYQALLLFGYWYAHRSTATFDTKKQTTIHAAVLLTALGALMIGAILTADHSPIAVVKSLSPQGDDYPFFGVIVLLTVAIGLPFFVVSTSAPLLQKWFAETGHPSSKDPYFLYAASNFGSLLALIAYPAIVEPNLRLIHQAWVWAIGYAVLVVLVMICARAVNRAKEAAANAPVPTAKVKGPPIPAFTVDEPEPSRLRKLRWVALAFVPSSLMLGLTTFVSTDMASIPLLWIIPLSLYLITFIIVFSKVPSWIHMGMCLLMPVMVLLIVFLMTSHVSAKFGLIVLLHMATFFVVTMVCHGELAADRPSAKHLTGFYLLMSVGGMLGGLFNALIAPIVFTFTSEYPITLVAACFLLPSMFQDSQKTPGKWTTLLDVIAPCAVFFLCCMIQPRGTQYEIGTYVYENGRYIIAAMVLFAIPAVASVVLFGKGIRMQVAMGVLLGGSLIGFALGKPLMSYFQSWKVFDGLGDSRSILNPDVWRWVPVAILSGAYVWFCRREGDKEKLNERLTTGLGALVVSFGLMLSLAGFLSNDVMRDMSLKAKIGGDTVRQILIYGLPAMLCYFFVERPVRFGAAVAALWLATFYTEYKEAKNSETGVVYDRSFFGRVKIETVGYPRWHIPWEPIPYNTLPDALENDSETYEEIVGDVEDGKQTIIYRLRETDKPLYAVDIYQTKDGKVQRNAFIRREFNQLVHGTTVHGLQQINLERMDIARALLPFNSAGPLEACLSVIGGAGEAMSTPGRDPLTYYHRTGPVGSMYHSWLFRNRQKANPNTAVACIGMGTASLTSYGAPGQKMVVFEIDTHVRKLVEPPKHFTFIDSARKQGVDVEIVMGDARISLERQDRKFGIMFVDAFSSDAIPAHLLTKQALQLYFDRLEDDGLLAVHISNRYLDLEPVVERIVRELGYHARVMHGAAGERSGKFAATWIAIAKSKEALGAIEDDYELWEREVASAQPWHPDPRGGTGLQTVAHQVVEFKPPSRRDRWIPLDKNDNVGLWTDDYSPIIPILRGEWRFWAKEE